MDSYTSLIPFAQFISDSMIEAIYYNDEQLIKDIVKILTGESHSHFDNANIVYMLLFKSYVHSDKIHAIYKLMGVDRLHYDNDEYCDDNTDCCYKYIDPQYKDKLQTDDNIFRIVMIANALLNYSIFDSMFPQSELNE